MNKQIAPRAAAILAFLSKAEARGNYLAYIGHSKNDEPFAKTIGECKAFQKRLVAEGHESSAVGAYQIITPTLNSLCTQLKLADSTPWTDDLQDTLGLALLNRRGYAQWAKGLMTNDSFANNLALEWASMPYYSDGRSYYGGVGSNRALVSRASFVAAIASAAKLSAVVESAPVAKLDVAPKPKPASTNEEPKMTDAVLAPISVTPAKSADPISSFFASAFAGIETKLKDVASGLSGDLGKGLATVTSAAHDGASFTDIATKAVGSAGSALDAAKEIGALVLAIRSGDFKAAGADIEALTNDAIAILAKFDIKLDWLTAASSLMAKYIG